jgi:hypothetical protein
MNLAPKGNTAPLIMESKALEDLAHQKDTDIMSTLSLFALKQIN